MAYLAWIVLLVALLGHTTSADSFYSHSDKPDVDIGLLPRPPPITPVDLNDTLLSDATVLKAREDKKPDPTDLGWIRRWAAIGDSFTAGIGAGNLYSQTDEDKRCSRYDRSYAAKLEQAIGDANFQYLACSGDRTLQINQQVKKLEGNLDFVILTGGGNDLCLVRRLPFFFFLRWIGANTCHLRSNRRTLSRPASFFHLAPKTTAKLSSRRLNITSMFCSDPTLGTYWENSITKCTRTVLSSTFCMRSFSTQRPKNAAWTRNGA